MHMLCHSKLILSSVSYELLSEVTHCSVSTRIIWFSLCLGIVRSAHNQGAT